MSGYRLTRAGRKLEVNDSMARLRIPEKGTLDLDLIGGTLWLELWDPRPFVHGASTLICPVSHGNSSGSRLETVSEESGMVITGSHSGTGETGRLRIDPKPLVVDEIEVEHDAVQIRVRKGPVLPTGLGMESTRLATFANHPFFSSGTDVSTGLILPEPSR